MSPRNPSEDIYFDPDTLKDLKGAFDEALGTLRQLGHNTDPILLSKRIMLLASNGERDRSRLCVRAMVEVLTNPSEQHSANHS